MQTTRLTGGYDFYVNTTYKTIKFKETNHLLFLHYILFQKKFQFEIPFYCGEKNKKHSTMQNKLDKYFLLKIPNKLVIHKMMIYI